MQTECSTLCILYCTTRASYLSLSSLLDSGVGEGSGSSSTQTDSYEETSFPGSHRPIDEDSSPLFIAFPPLEVSLRINMTSY